MRLLIIRHATPDYKNKTIKPIGHLEARALSKKLKNVDIHHIYCSPMGRAQDTMNYTAKALGIIPVTLDWMQELVSWKLSDGRYPWQIHSDIVFCQGEYKDAYNWHQAPTYRESGIQEQFEDLQKKIDDFILDLGYLRMGNQYKCVTQNNETIAIFCHAGFGSALVSHLLSIPFPIVATGFPLKPTGVSYIEFKSEEGELLYPVCTRYGDTSHLDHTDRSYI